jgi:hypothetical protein
LHVPVAPSPKYDSSEFKLSCEALAAAYMLRPKIITRTNFLCRIKEIRIFPVQISDFFVSNFV